MVPLRKFSTALILLMLAAPAAAQEAGAPPNSSLNADAFRLPSSAYDTSKPHKGRAAPTSAPEAFRPGQFDLGDASVLQFDARRTTPSGVGIEAIDPKRLGGIRRDDSKPLNYFGMTLSKPLN